MLHSPLCVVRRSTSLQTIQWPGLALEGMHDGREERSGGEEEWRGGIGKVEEVERSRGVVAGGVEGEEGMEKMKELIY